MSRPLLVAIPTYNERENVPVLLGMFRQLSIPFEILFVDDASPDGTGDLIESLRPEWPNIHLLRRAGKLGIGSAHQAAIEWAYERKYPLLATMDADLTHDPRYLPEMLERLATGQVVVGSRFLKGGSLPGWNAYRQSVTHFGHFLTRFFLKLPYDATGALRLYNLEAIPRGVFRLVRSSGYSFFYESLFMLANNGLRIEEVIVSLPARTYGSSKMSLEQVFCSVLRLLFLYTNIRANPDLFRYKDFSGESATMDVPVSLAWEGYWGERSKDRWSDILIDLLATWFRVSIIRPHLTRTMEKFFSPHETLLHAGCGSGQVDRHIRYWLKITGCDLSPTAVKMYRQINWPYCRAVAGDIFQLPFPPDSFDGVYNLGVMEHFNEEEIARSLAEIFRVLRPGGRVVLFWPSAKSLPSHVLAWLAEFSNRSAGNRPPLFPPEISRVKSRKQGEDWLRNAGFKPVYYEFGPRDLFTQCVFVAEKSVSTAEPAV